MARFISIPPMPAFDKRSNGKTEYRNTSALAFVDDDATTYTVRAGWRSDGVSWPLWLLPAIIAIFVIAAASWGVTLLGVLKVPLAVRILLTGYAGLWAILCLALPNSKLMPAAFLHDWLCQQIQQFPDKSVIDQVFYRAMRANGVPLVYALPMYLFERLSSERVEWQQPEFKPITDAAGDVVGWT